MKVQDLMVSDVVTLPPKATVTEAAELMDRKEVATVLVTEGRELRGLVTDRKVVTECLAKNRNPSTTPIDEIMTPAGTNTSGVITVDPEMDVMDAARLMGHHKVRRLPVVSHGELLGIISVADLASALRGYLGNILDEISSSET